ncbi:MAG: hypothetical protein GWN29_07590, partial [Gammaproteobacteria bacterium]|nr:hypothetical protein [Gammaproteobacteria bacterium]
SRALLQYVGDKLNVSAAGLTHETIRQRLGEAGSGTDASGRVVEVLEHCDAARFAPGGFTEDRMREVLGEVETLVTELESSWSRKTSRFVATSAMLVLCASILLPVTTVRAQSEADGPPQDQAVRVQ